MKNLEQYIETINSSQTPEEAFSGFCSILGKHGYDRIAYSLVTDHPSLGLPRQHGLATSYPEDWMKFYAEKNYIEIDPVTRKCLASRKPFFWSEVTNAPDVPAPSFRLMKEAEEAGVSDGIGISLCGQSGELVGIGLARNATKSAQETKDYTFLAGAYLLSVYFHETFRDMLAKPRQVEITKRQSEILCWAAEGKTDEEIAMILNISQNTVRFHWKQIFGKLGANGRIYAITKAIRLQLINPHFVFAPYQKR